jgi:hypothetical protein
MFMPCTTALALRKGENMIHSAVSFLTTCMLVYALVGIGSASAVAAVHPSDTVAIRWYSWLVTYDVEAFGVVIPIPLSKRRGHDRDQNGQRLPPRVLGTPILSNGHGAWKPVAGKGTIAYLYRKVDLPARWPHALRHHEDRATGKIAPMARNSRQRS